MRQRLTPLHYFAYGSNMNPQRVAARKLPTLGDPKSAVLHNYKLLFNKISRYRVGAASANIVPSFGSSVYGVVYQLRDERAIRSMDPFENSPEDYAREPVFVHLSSDDFNSESMTIAAWTYIAKPHAMDDRLRPTREYVEHLLASPFMTENERARLMALEYHDG